MIIREALGVRRYSRGFAALRPSPFELALTDPSAQTVRMKIEHFALQVSEPVAMADWYVKHLGFTIARAVGEPTNARFLTDSSGAVMIEIYRNPQVAVPDYNSMNPLLLHVAFISKDLAADRDRLVKAGAGMADEIAKTPAGDEIMMLCDPWGIAIQFVKRSSPMLR